MRIDLHRSSAFVATGGRPFDAALPSIAFIHGAGFESSVWALHSRWFAFHGWSALAVDLPGHGRSAGPPLCSIGEMADWVLDLVTKLGAAPCVLVGHSMGALIAAEAASRAPREVRGLGLVGAAARMPVHRDLLEAAQANQRSALYMLNLWGHGDRAAFGGHQAPGLWMLGLGMRVLEHSPPGTLYADLAACNAYEGAEAARIHCPTVVICGERDKMTPLSGGRQLAASIAASRLVVIAQAGHMLLAECPDATREALVQTFGELPSRASAVADVI